MRLAYGILDGSLVPIDRGADQKPYCSAPANVESSVLQHARQAGQWPVD
jgi:hypothetical protein